MTVAEAIRFHGHLGPYLILGILAGESALKKIKCKKFFGLEVKVWGAQQKPQSCLIDGLQLSTGATYGKGNIKKGAGSKIKIEVSLRQEQKGIIINFKDSLMARLAAAKTHQACELLAKKLYRSDYSKLFRLHLTTEN